MWRETDYGSEPDENWDRDYGDEEWEDEDE